MNLYKFLKKHHNRCTLCTSMNSASVPSLLGYEKAWVLKFYCCCCCILVVASSSNCRFSKWHLLKWIPCLPVATGYRIAHLQCTMYIVQCTTYDTFPYCCCLLHPLKRLRFYLATRFSDSYSKVL